MERCGAKLRGKNTTCRKWPVHGSNRCELHGGKTPRGHALPQTTHGRYSKDLPTRLGERFLASQSDPDLLNLNAEIALTDARLGELIQRVDTDGAGVLWNQLGGVVSDMESFLWEEDLDGLSGSVQQLRSVLQRARDDSTAWDQIYPLMEQRRKLVETERKRRVEMDQIITTEQAMVLVTRLTSAVRRHVNDERTLAAIAAEFGETLGPDGPATTGPR